MAIFFAASAMESVSLVVGLVGTIVGIASLTVVVASFFGNNFCSMAKRKRLTEKLTSKLSNAASPTNKYLILTCSGNSVVIAYEIFQKLKARGYDDIEFVCLPIQPKDAVSPIVCPALINPMPSTHTPPTHSCASSNKHYIFFNKRFFISKSNSSQKIIVIDDVSTTGSTLKAISDHLITAYGVTASNITTAALITSDICYSASGYPTYFGAKGTLGNLKMAWRSCSPHFGVAKYQQSARRIERKFLK